MKNNKPQELSTAIYLGALNTLGRWNKVIPALNQHFIIIGDNTSTGKCPALLRELIETTKLPLTCYKLRKLHKQYPSLLIMVSSISPSNLGLGIITKTLKLPFFIRLRGGMWKELEDLWELKPFPIKQIYSILFFSCRNRLLSLADGIITVSNFNKKQVIESNLANPNKVATVYNPVNLTSLNATPEGNFKSKLNISKKGKIILTVTGFTYYNKYMGIVYYLPAILQALEENHDWYFIIAGGGYSFKQARDNILKEVPANLKDRIIFTGHYNPIEEAFKDADIVVHFSFRETAPNVVIEAQAAMKPVIINNFGGTPELLQKHHSNPKCLIAEVPELYQSLVILMKSQTLRQSMGQQSKQAVVDRFSYASIANDFYKCINSLLDQKGNPG